jgi:pimeloyl-ACP methyl ester carboxylesterase
MSATLRLAVLLLAGVALWILLSSWVVSGSERFYLLIPPLVLCARPGRAQRRHVPGLLFVAGLAVLGTIFVAVFAGTHALYVAETWCEVATSIYFLLAVTLLVIGARHGLRLAASGLSQRLWSANSRALGRTLLVDVIPAGLLLVFVLPYLMGLFYVHRFKVTNVHTPLEAYGRAYEDVDFRTSDGLTIRGWFIPASESSERTLLICHGLGANRSMFLSYITVADRFQANVLIFDFRGHGESDGHTVTLGHLEKYDVLAAVEFLRTHKAGQAKEVMGLGISMGSAALVRAAAEVEPPLTAVVVDSGFAAATDLTDNILRAFPGPMRAWLAVPGIPLASLHAGCWLPDIRPVDCIANVRAPVLIVHTKNDPLIPYEHAVRMHGSAREPKSLLLAETNGHGSVLGEAPSDYLAAISALLQQTRR